MVNEKGGIGRRSRPFSFSICPITFELLTPLAAVCILSPAIFSRRPCGTLSNNKICKTIKIPLARDEEDKCAV